MNPGSEKELTRAVRGCLAKLTAELAKDAGVSRDDILEITLVGNPIMHHLLLGLDPTELGGAPFALTIDEAVRRPAGDLGIPANPGARAYVLPLHRRPCRRRRGRRDPLRGAVPRRGGQPDRRHRHERRDRARQPRPAPAPRRARRALLSRARRSAAVSARRPARSSACGSTPRRSSRASA